jgi:hypothetical protein
MDLVVHLQAHIGSFQKRAQMDAALSCAFQFIKEDRDSLHVLWTWPTPLTFHPYSLVPSVLKTIENPGGVSLASEIYFARHRLQGALNHSPKDAMFLHGQAHLTKTGHFYWRFIFK